MRNRFAPPASAWATCAPRNAVIYALLLGFAAAAQAAGWQGAVGLTSDKVQRGFSENNGRAVALLDLGHAWDTGWAVAGGVAGPVYETQGGQAEFSLSLSKAWQLDNDWLVQGGVGRYEVTGAPRARAYRNKELYASLGWRGQVSLALTASPDTARFVPGDGLRSGRVWALELGLHQRLVDRLALDGGAGYLNLDGLQSPGYAYGSLGLSYGWGPVQAFVSFINSRARARGAAGATQAGPRWVTTLSYGF
jgi:uncharacterized protein (TIGR02001 family)